MVTNAEHHLTGELLVDSHGGTTTRSAAAARGADHQIRGRLQEVVPGRLGEHRPPRIASPSCSGGSLTE